MSSVYVETNAKGRKYLKAEVKNFNDGGKVRRIHLGAFSNKTAKNLWAVNVQKLEDARENALAVPKDMDEWVFDLPENVRNGFVKVGLLRQPKAVPKTFAALCAYVLTKEAEDRGNGAGTVNNQNNICRHAIKFFEGVDVPKDDVASWYSVSKLSVASILPDEVKAFMDQCSDRRTGRPHAANTKIGTLKTLAKVFAVAVKARIIEANPCEGLTSSYDRSDNLEYVPVERFRDLAEKLDTEWQVILGLAMFAGLRAPSEINLLRWQDILWRDKKMLVRSTKNAKKGKKFTERDVPIFDELFPKLLQLWQESGRPDNGNVIVEHRTPKNVRGQWDGYSSPIKKLAKRHEVKLWPRALQNLRASFVSRKVCLENVPLATVCKWVEQSEVVAGKHYIVLGDENFAEASTWSVEDWDPNWDLQPSAPGCNVRVQEYETLRFAGLCSPLHPSAEVKITPKGI